MKKRSIFKFGLLFVGMMFCQSVFSQTTEFTYQGSLKNASAPATGNYDFEFVLYDAVSGGAQIGSTLTRTSVAVADGNFAVKLDFGANFPGANRFLEIRVRQTGGGGFTPLAPRQAVNSSPYSVQSLNATNATTATTAANATQLGGLSAGGFIQNTASPQASSNFNISGTGTANILNAVTQFNIGGVRILYSPGTNNLAAGIGAGGTSISGSNNSFFGTSAGGSTPFLSGSNNAMFGYNAGVTEFPGDNVSGNSLFGSNSRGASSSSDLTLIGFAATTSLLTGPKVNATAIGARSQVSASNSLVLGSINGINGATADTRVGIGTTAPQYALHVVGQNIRVEGNSFPRFSVNFTGGAADEKRWQNYASANALNFTALNDAENAETSWLQVNRGTETAISSVQFPNGNVVINNLGTGGATTLCRNASNQISTCSSSRRYKSNINSFNAGLSLIKQLRPVSFNWKDGGMSDMGLVAEEVNAVEPLLTTTNSKGEIEGVKYDRVGVVLVSAVQEQQRQIEKQQKQIEQQRKQIESLTKIVCATNSTADICRQ